MAREFLSRFADQLTDRITHDPRVAQWRVNLSHSGTVRVGIDANHLGGPYSAPRAVDQAAGEVYIVWNDGRRSIARVDPGNLANNQLLDDWRASSYEDPDKVDVLTPVTLPEVSLYSPAIQAEVENPSGRLFKPLARYSELQGKARFVSGSAGASAVRTLMRSSGGHDFATDETSYFTMLSLDSRYSDEWAGRRFVEPAELDQLVASTTERHTQLGREARGWLAPGTMDVVLEPGVVEGLFGHYMLSNLSGSNVASGQSAFAPGDFGSRRVARSDVSLYIDPLRHMHPGSYRSTREGVAAARLALVKEGVLASPMLDVKYANRLGLKPTPLAAGTASLVLDAPMTSEKEITLGESALLVCEVLGIHTQDAASGNFSLTASQSLEVSAAGEVGGKVKAVISGNFFAVLADPATRFARVEGKDLPMMRVRCQVSLG